MVVKYAYMHMWFFCSTVCKVIIFNIFLLFNFFSYQLKMDLRKGKVGSLEIEYVINFLSSTATH